MFWIKLSLIVLWFIAGVLLFSRDVERDFPSLKLVFDYLGLNGKKSTSVKPAKVVAKPVVKKEPVVVPPPAPVVVKKPTPKPAPLPEPKEEVVEEDNALANVQIFKKKIKARATWYASLTDAEKLEFRSYFVEDAPTHLVKDLTYKLNGNNDQFFEKVFNYIYEYRKVISSKLLQKLTDELLFFAEGDPEVQTLVYEAATRVAYYRRKDKTMLAYAETLARADVALQQGALKAKNSYVYSFTRLAIILERRGDIQEAITLVNDALARKLTDRTKTGYQGRKERLQKRLAK